MRRIVLFVFVLLLGGLNSSLSQAQPLAEPSPVPLPRGLETAADLLVPGRKQLREGARVRGAVFAGLGFTGVVSLSVAQWTYARKVDIANAFETDYRTQIAGLRPLKDFADEQGYVTEWDLYRRWQSTHDSARDFEHIRAVVLWSVAGIYVLNAVDVVLGAGGKRRVRAVPLVDSGAGGKISGIRFQIEI